MNIFCHLCDGSHPALSLCTGICRALCFLDLGNITHLSYSMLLNKHLKLAIKLNLFKGRRPLFCSQWTSAMSRWVNLWKTSFLSSCIQNFPLRRRWPLLAPPQRAYERHPVSGLVFRTFYYRGEDYCSLLHRQQLVLVGSQPMDDILSQIWHSELSITG